MTKMIQFELRKIFSKRLTQIALIMILVFSGVLGFSSFQNKYAFDGISKEGSGKAAVEIDKEIAAKYEGLLTDEKVRQMMNDFSSNTDLHGMNAAYLYHNAMQSAVFTRFSDTDGNWNGSSVADVFGGESIKIGYVDGWLTTSQNMVKTQTSHIKNGIRTLKNQYFSPQNTLMRLFLSVPMHPACILGDAEQSWL